MKAPLVGFALALGALGYGLYATLGGRMPALSGARGSRRYHLVAINGKTGRKERVSSSPLSHHEAVTMKSKFNPHRNVRIQLEELRGGTSLRGDTETTELKLFIDNDGELYRQQTTSIIKNLQRKIKKGVFDKSKAEKLWMYLVENGAKKYVREFSANEPGEWHKVFSMADRKAVAKALNEDFMAEQGVRA